VIEQLLGAAAIRSLATELGIRPTKKWGQNFVIDPNTVRRIVTAAGVESTDRVLEVGPGLGSLTLALLPYAESVTALEIDPVLAEALPRTVAGHAPEYSGALTILQCDALTVTQLPVEPTCVVANLPYNVAVPVLLHLLASFPSLRTALVMVQKEVAERLAAVPGSKIYGVPSVKARWFGEVEYAGNVGRGVFWPAPNVDSGLVRVRVTGPRATDVDRSEVFTLIDAAFAQRRKTLRSSLSAPLGGREHVEQVLAAAEIDPGLRGEDLGIDEFIAIARAARSAPTV
jgi:16S rRNA (adenine1518-N6/adenine1519-N6)-dimethyltransferase